jgi:starch phosphorylase
MKTLVNGGLNLSILDGWWAEAYSPECGFAFGDGVDSAGEERDGIEAEALYRILENEVVPQFYGRDGEGIPRAWVAKVRKSMMGLTPRFSSRRMVREYVERAYVPASAAYAARSADGARLARELEAFRQRVRLNWRGLRFVSVRVTEGPDGWRFEADVYLGDLSPGEVRVEIYADPAPGEEAPRVNPLRLTGTIPGTINGFRYAGTAPSDRPADHYTARIVPSHPAAFLPLEASEVFWSR